MTEQPDPQLADVLQRLRTSVPVPPVDRARERALLQAFDNRVAAPVVTRRVPIALASALAGAVVAIAITARPAAPVRPSPPDQAVADFISWPGAEAYPTLESASVVRVQLPAELIVALGLASPAVSDSTMAADLLVGQDGLTRAVRLVSTADGSAPQ